MSVIIRGLCGSSVNKTGLSPGICTNIKIANRGVAVEIMWRDPQDITGAEAGCPQWKGTKVIKKIGSPPKNIKDGEMVVESVNRNKYETAGFLDTNVQSGTIYYYGIFPFSIDEIYNYSIDNVVHIEYLPYRVVGCVIDQSSTDPESCVTYTDSALGDFTAGSEEWDNFFRIRPCLFKEGHVIGYLNPDNFAQFEDGSSADITSGESGDVMIEFPRRGLNVSTSPDGIKVSIKMTDNPHAEGFEYYAHQRGNVNKDCFYLGAYTCTQISNKLRSLSGRTSLNRVPLGTFRSYAHSNGSGYELFGYYQFSYIQACYVLKYKNLDSRNVIGYGLPDLDASKMTTGALDTKGMHYGTHDYNSVIKLFGLEGLWGSYDQLLDGMCSSKDGGVVTGTDNFNDQGTGYQKSGLDSSLASNLVNTIDTVYGTTKLPFLPKSVKSGGRYRSECYISLRESSSSYSAKVGGGNDSDRGIFYFSIGSESYINNGDIWTSSRLMYL